MRAIDGMRAMVDNVLDDARLESGTLTLSIASHPVADIVAQSIDLLQPLADQKRIALAAGSSNGESIVPCDRDRVAAAASGGCTARARAISC